MLRFDVLLGYDDQIMGDCNGFSRDSLMSLFGGAAGSSRGQRGIVFVPPHD